MKAMFGARMKLLVALALLLTACTIAFDPDGVALQGETIDPNQPVSITLLSPSENEEVGRFLAVRVDVQNGRLVLPNAEENANDGQLYIVVDGRPLQTNGQQAILSEGFDLPVCALAPASGTRSVSLRVEFRHGGTVPSDTAPIVTTFLKNAEGHGENPCVEVSDGTGSGS
ncbi:MAG: hypothetical protein KC561_00430 [Myxococcales bacterium]|nr:hypothetical protein [Myxococcales bacterium]